MKRLIRQHGELYLVDRDYEHHCSVYLYIDYTSLDWMSFICCDAINPYRAKKSVRLECGQPVAVRPNHPLFQKTQYWNINEDGYDKILIGLLSRKNSRFPAHTNWERMRILYLKHDWTHGEKWWLSRSHNYAMPDYTGIYGICNWDYDDNDPDGAMPVSRKNEFNLGVWASSYNGFGLLVYDDCDRFRAKKVAKISIFALEYLPYTPNDYACMKTLWRLNAEERKSLLKILKNPFDSSIAQYTNWNQALSWIDMNGAILACDEDGQAITSLNNLPRDLPIPDYTLLPD